MENNTDITGVRMWFGTVLPGCTPEDIAMLEARTRQDAAARQERDACIRAYLASKLVDIMTSRL
jgi:hypothetical protein